MAITFVAAGTAAEAASGNIAALPRPAGLADLDVEVGYLVAKDNVSVTLPGTWTKKAEINSGTGLRLTIFWRRFATGDSTAAITVTHALGDVIRGRIFAYRGVVTTGDPFEATLTRANASVAGTGSQASLSLTTTSADAWRLHVIAVGDDTTAAVGASFAVTTTPAGVTVVVERDDWETATGTDESAGFYDCLQAAAGTQLGIRVTYTPTAAAFSANWEGALTPAPPGVALTRGDSTADGRAPAPQTDLTRGDGTADGRASVPNVPLTRGGSIADGRAPAGPEFATLTRGEAIANGTSPIASVTVSRGGAAADGRALSAVVSSILPRGNATAGGRAVSIRTSLTRGGCNAGGTALVFRVPLLRGGAIADGRDLVVTSGIPAPDIDLPASAFLTDTPTFLLIVEASATVNLTSSSSALECAAPTASVEVEERAATAAVGSVTALLNTDENGTEVGFA